MILQGENIVSGGSSLPIGTIIATVSDTPDIGYLFCHGQAVSRLAYPILFAKIGTKYGIGDGSTTFNLPDCREASLVGAGTNVLNSAQIVAHNALIAGQFQDDQFKKHSHSIQRDAGGSYDNCKSVPSGLTNDWYAGTGFTTQYAGSSATTHGKQLGVNYQIKVSNHGILPVNAIDDTQITNANTFSAEYINNKTQTLRYNANFTLPTFLDGTRVRLANTHATNTITCTLPTGQTMNGQSSFTIAPDTLLEFELIGTAWKCVSNEWELFYTFTAFSTGLSIDFAQYKTLMLELYTTGNYNVATRIVKMPINTIRISFWEDWGAVRYGGVGVLVSGTTITGIATMMFQDTTFKSLKIYGMK